jgi:surface carbohydrate biosynthesis protein
MAISFDIIAGFVRAAACRQARSRKQVTMPMKSIVSPRRWLLLPIETKARELMGKTLLACHAAERGWGVIMGDKGIVRHQQTLLPKGVVLEKDADPTHEELVTETQASGNRLTAMDEEGLVFFSGEAYLRARISKTYFEALDFFFAWGNEQAKWLETIGGSNGAVVRAGNPRFDLLRPEFRSVFSEGSEKLQCKFGRIILFNTNFGMANPYTGRDVIAYLKHCGKISNREVEQFYKGARDFEQRQLRTFVEAVPLVARRYSDHTVIVRPHPSENHEFWQRIAREHNNMEVRFQGSAAEWISAAEVTIHTNCTTGIEAYLLDRPVISYSINTDERFDFPITNDVSIQAASEEELFALLDKVLTGSAIDTDPLSSARKAEVARQYVSGTNGTPAVETIMDKLETLDLPMERAVFPMQPKRPNLFSRVTYRARGMAKRMLNSGSTPGADVHPAYGKQKFPGIEQSEMQELIKGLARASGKFESINLTSVCENTFCLYRS